jgi:protein ImuA
MIEELRQRLRDLEKPPGLEDGPAALPLGASAVDRVLGGGLVRGALHEIAAAGEAHVAAATGFAMGVAARASSSPRSAGSDKHIVWVAEDMAALESGAPYGPGLDGVGVAPERLTTVAVAQRRDLLWAMEEVLRCRAVACVVGEMRRGALDAVAVRRLSLAAAETGALALILRATPGDDASTAATRWMVGASPSPGGGGSPNQRVRAERGPMTGSARRGGVILQKRSPPPGAITRHSRCSASASSLSMAAEGRLCLPPAGGGEERESVPRFAVALLRNRRGSCGQWILEWSDSDGRFTLAAHAQPVALPPVHRPHRQIAQNVA